jgi:alanine dehydrogenase
VLTLSEAQVREALAPTELLVEIERGFGALARGDVHSPARQEIKVPDKGFSLAMMAWQSGMQICVKIVNVFEANLRFSLPSHLAMIQLFDPGNGLATCVMDATYLTAARTAAAAIVSAKLLSRPDSRIATVIGAGTQGREHLRLLPLIRDFDDIQICSAQFEHAERLAMLDPRARAVRNVEDAVRRSHVVCLATNSPAPVIEAEWIVPGTHVSSIGYQPPLGELPRALLAYHRLFVETSQAFLPPPVGCAELTGIDPSGATPLGEVVNDPARGRALAEEITVYKAMGVGMEDLVAANLAYRCAASAGIGSQMDW